MVFGTNCDEDSFVVNDIIFQMTLTDELYRGSNTQHNIRKQ